ncbi:hypothetical protein D1641_04835 [Colidextribacter sp. OB.20]|uniref:hypothetical protein n=1 Tax=Colidextribacter sp. OB.20 TaxID=2304568 RepID=UPI00136B7AA0|nr:hypothetical protein [Colidextribacter sp. OB.20]NBI09346.1 hypothetical protein [Colidextribacter sp. OB.20]
MPAVPVTSGLRDMPPVPQDQLPLFFAPFFALLGVLGLALVGWELPAILLLFSAGEPSALVLLRAYWTGRMTFSVLALLSPLLFLGLTLLLYWLTARRLDPEIRKQNRLAPFILMPFLLPFIGILMWAALVPGGTCAFCDEIAADIQQIEAGETQWMTVFISGQSHPDPLFTDQPEGWQVTRRTIFSPGDGWGGITLRFPEALESTLDPEGFVVIGRAYDQSWDGVQWYEVSYTSNFQLVVEITPVER